jgi:hypothetical protein
MTAMNKIDIRRDRVVDLRASGSSEARVSDRVDVTHDFQE